ncbi:hypothetical protein HK096_000744 [Nowakowskiella sp. JEL0078]|nr:hypothetical protein HK096_000744 [Nowakowskiella sp. JEL0078]
MDTTADIITAGSSSTNFEDIVVEDKNPVPANLLCETLAVQPTSNAGVSTHAFPLENEIGARIFNYTTYTIQPLKTDPLIHTFVGSGFVPEQTIADEVRAKSIPLLNEASQNALKIRNAQKKEVAMKSEEKLLKRVPSLIQKSDSIPREYNTGGEVEHMISAIGITKIANPIDKTLFLGFLAGTFIAFGGMFQISVTGGTPPELRAIYPFVPKLLTAVTFPIALVLIVMFGGELFTGNTMILSVSWLDKRVTLKELLLNWFLVFVSNLLSIALVSYLLAYLTGIFAAEPYRSYITSVAVTKVSYSYGAMILRGIPANALVCLAFFLGLAARDVTGKILGMYIPIACFAATGWEHCVANMFFILTGWMYGANVTLGGVCANIFLVAIGNIIGGALLIGGSEYYLYHWHSNNEPTRHKGKKITFPKKKATAINTFEASADNASIGRRSSLSQASQKREKRQKKWWKLVKSTRNDTAVDEEKALN